MSAIKIFQIIEALGGGVYTYFENLTNFLKIKEIFSFI